MITSSSEKPSVSEPFPAESERRLMIIVNPISGTQSKREIVTEAGRRLREARFGVTVRITRKAGDARALALEAVRDGYFGVIAAGGDGTVNECADAVRNTGTALGILPLGSGNGLARHLYGSIDVGKAIGILCRGNIEACDYGMADDHPFFCTFGLGFDAAVSERFASMKSRGLPTYIRSAIREYFSYRPSPVEIETPEGILRTNAFLLTVCNASQYGNNVFVAPHASLRDGLLDIIIVSSNNPVVHALAGLQMIYGPLADGISITSLKVSEAIIRRVGNAAHIDGENIEFPEEIHVQCRAAQLRLFTDPDKEPFRPILTPLRSIRRDLHFLIRSNLDHLTRNLR